MAHGTSLRARPAGCSRSPASADRGPEQRALDSPAAPDLVIDEFGFQPMSRQEASGFFRLVDHRQGRGSILITLNKGIRDWPEVRCRGALGLEAVGVGQALGGPQFGLRPIMHSPALSSRGTLIGLAMGLWSAFARSGSPVGSRALAATLPPKTSPNATPARSTSSGAGLLDRRLSDRLLPAQGPGPRCAAAPRPFVASPRAWSAVEPPPRVVQGVTMSNQKSKLSMRAMNSSNFAAFPSMAIVPSSLAAISVVWPRLMASSTARFMVTVASASSI